MCHFNKTKKNTVMKSIIKKIILVLVIPILFTACDDDFLDRTPENSITEPEFFQTEGDLQVYTDGLHSNIGTSYNDLGSDNISHHNSGSQMDQLLRGDVNEDNIGGWSWSNLRKINYFLVRYERAGVSDEIKNHYGGIAHYFRALEYFNKIKSYGEVPIYTTDLATNDDELLYKAKDSRADVFAFIMEDLQFAIDNIRESSSKTRISKMSALALASRIALHEGTYRKYHTELGLSDGDLFLQKSADASTAIIASGKYSIYNTGSPSTDFTNMFSNLDLSSNPEIILYQDFDKTLTRFHNSATVMDYEYALSRSLVDTYLKTDGTPFTSESGNETKTFDVVFENRDPRMSQTAMPPGFKRGSSTNEYVLKASLGGYVQIKFFPTNEDGITWAGSYNDLPVFRYAEILLNYAEAKAELGTLTQGDLDMSVNLLRDRAGMPHLVLADAIANVDPVLANRYHNVGGDGAILEVRRERRVELACEGRRQDDLSRWKLGKILENSEQGIYIPEFGAYDVTGDGIPDIAILSSPTETGPIDGLPNVDQLAKYFISDNVFYLEDGSEGRIMFVSDRDRPKTFTEPKYYYIPIPRTEILLNPNLTQSEGW